MNEVERLMEAEQHCIQASIDPFRSTNYYDGADEYHGTAKFTRVGELVIQNGLGETVRFTYEQAKALRTWLIAALQDHP